MCYESSTVVSDSLFGDVAAALREHGSATLDEHCCYFLRPGCVLVGGHRDLRSLGITDCPVTAMTVTRCDGRDITGVRYPPICAVASRAQDAPTTVQIGVICVRPRGWPARLTEVRLCRKEGVAWRHTYARASMVTRRPVAPVRVLQELPRSVVKPPGASLPRCIQV